MKQFNYSPIELFRSLVQNKDLLLTLIKREVLGRYRGSIIGIFWSFLTPLFMLAVYTLVFSQIFKTRWPGAQTDSQGEFALTLFAGLIIFNFFSECITRAPTIISSNVNYVKKVVFPLELLPLVIIGVSVFHMIISIVVWLIVYCLFFGLPHSTIIITPFIIIPLIMITCGITFILSSIGTYLRDIVQLVGVTITAMMFLSPIFFPISVLPFTYQKIALLNPLTLPIEQMRLLMLNGETVSLSTLLIYNLIAVIVLILGFSFFQKTRRGFADVL